MHEDVIDLHRAVASIKQSSLNPLYQSDEEEEERDRSERDSPEGDKDDDHVPVTPLAAAMAGHLPPWQTYYVLVERSKEMTEQREKLPVFAEEQRIMEVLRDNPVTIICGETGSGKTTQVPQFLYEAGFGDPAGPNPGLIGITQPRRVAATSMARRVGEELGRPEHVAYQIRYDATVSLQTRIKFMTDGIMLREIGDDFLLQKYSAILLDEAHERNLNTDILIGMLSRAVRLRNQMAQEQPERIRPLRLIIMSATLNVEEFQAPRLFSPPPPLIKVDARQHPVTIHFARRTNPDHVEAAYRMVCKVHANLPPGGILLFLTGKQDIAKLAHKLRRKYCSPHVHVGGWKEDPAGVFDGQDEEEDDQGTFVYKRVDPSSQAEEQEDPNPDLDEDEPDEDDDEFAVDADTQEPLHILPLYALLAPEEQQKVFQPPPPGHRLCVLSTNVAETSLTIPNIRYVIDCGLVKQKHYDVGTGTVQYRLEWTSRASATQRAGRAGRVGPGHCYRLYSSAVFDQHFSEHTLPEIRRIPIDGLVLQLKAMGIDHADRFPLPSPPEPEAVIAAQRTLLRLGALGESAGSADVRITRLGRKMSKLPLAPPWSRLVIVALESGQLSVLAVALAAVLAVGDPFLEDASANTMGEAIEAGNASHSLRQAQLELAGKPPTSDLLLWLNAFIRYQTETPSSRRSFCRAHHLMSKRMEEMAQQYRLLLRLLRPMYSAVDWSAPLSSTSVAPVSRILRKLIAESLSDRVAERVVKVVGRKRNLPAYRLSSLSTDDPHSIVYLHPSSVVKTVAPPVLVYAELISSAANEPGAQPVRYLKHVTSVEPAWTGC